jgi:UDP-N-acetylglucosamine 2-epimerase (non-hydrolysing)
MCPDLEGILKISYYARNMKRVVLIAAARLNFMKIALLHRALIVRGILTYLVHTRWHDDEKMSNVFYVRD